MSKQKLVIWVGVGLALVLVAVLLASNNGMTVGGFVSFGGDGSDGPITDVNAQEMQELVDQGVRVVDVRTEGEYVVGHIPGAELVPMNQVTAAAATWDPAEPIAIYCATGSRSVEVVNYLIEQGFQEVYHYASGIVTWEGQVEQGEAIAAAPAPATESSGLPVMYEFYTDS